MKIAIITDLHFDYKPDSEVFARSYEHFYNNLLFPTLKERGIKRLLCLGDVFDKRKTVNVKAFQQAERLLFTPLQENDIHSWFIVGNHDVYYKTTNKINSLTELIGERFPVLTEPHEFSPDDKDPTPILLIPWINQENEEAVFKALSTSKAKYVFGHFEISGFGMSKGTVSTVGLDRSVFKRFDVVGSGHYHTRSTDGQIYYMGAGYQMTWADYDDPKGFHIFDTDTGEFEFIQNDYEIFVKVLYDGKETKEPKNLEGKIVRLVVIKNEDPKHLEKFVTKLQLQNPAELKVIEQKYDVNNVSVESHVDVQDTLSLINEYIDELEIDAIERKVAIKDILTSVYREAELTENT